MPYLEEGELEDYEYPDDDDVDGDSDDCYVNCPECGALVYDDSPQCTECDHYMSSVTSVSPLTKSVAIALLVVFVLLAVFL